MSDSATTDRTARLSHGRGDRPIRQASAIHAEPGAKRGPYSLSSAGSIPGRSMLFHTSTPSTSSPGVLLTSGAAAEGASCGVLVDVNSGTSSSMQDLPRTRTCLRRMGEILACVLARISQAKRPEPLLEPRVQSDSTAIEQFGRHGIHQRLEVLRMPHGGAPK